MRLSDFWADSGRSCSQGHPPPWFWFLEGISVAICPDEINVSRPNYSREVEGEMGERANRAGTEVEAPVWDAKPKINLLAPSHPDDPYVYPSRVLLRVLELLHVLYKYLPLMCGLVPRPAPSPSPSPPPSPLPLFHRPSCNRTTPLLRFFTSPVPLSHFPLHSQCAPTLPRRDPQTSVRTEPLPTNPNILARPNRT